MTNLEKYNQIFVLLFGIPENEISDDLNALNVETWDSVAQMNMASFIEEEFEILLEPEEIIELVSYKNGINILLNHDIKL